jgi:hypothetical protein
MAKKGMAAGVTVRLTPFPRRKNDLVRDAICVSSKFFYAYCPARLNMTILPEVISGDVYRNLAFLTVISHRW